MVFGPHNILPDREQRMFIRLLRGRPVLIPGDGTTVGQVGHVDDQARALRMLMGNSRTFGRRYNLTGGDAYTDEGYVDTFAQVLGVAPRKVFVPAPLMDDLYAGRVRLVRLNLEENLWAASRYGILSVPTVLLFVEGEPKATVLGAQPRERFLREFSPHL